MDTTDFWALIERARRRVADPSDSETVAEEAVALLAVRPVEEIVAAQQAFWELMALSYRSALWGAAHIVNGGCSDDAFEYFRGWLITQGRETFERVVADPDALADLTVIRDSVYDGLAVDGEVALSIAWDAHLKATGEHLPSGGFRVEYAHPGPAWDLDDPEETARQLPRLSALFAR
ncbi:DUF4240 domain-containing protein [Streptomyces cavernae]|uniref:DUF4240 domain-containing protein n=1 Tax=Streptomyces cavernae TaxID=2259034 RepID=UPI000FEB88E8|nr:DUF4240 domain-containing protein [Streptomyces cavernae]